MKVERSAGLWVLEAIALLALVCTVVLPLAFWADLPATVPTHFGIDGTADGWGPKITIFVLPACALVTYLVLYFGASNPATVNIPLQLNREHPAIQQLLLEMVTVLKAAVLLLLLGIIWQSLQTALGKAAGLGPTFLPLSMGLLFLPLLFYFFKLKQCQRKLDSMR